MAYHYQHRGKELRDMSSLVYNLTISIMPSNEKPGTEVKKAAASTAGRPLSNVFHFATTHQLYPHYVQVERAKMICPMHTGERRARFPAPLTTGAVPSQSYIQQFDRAAAFYAANFIPWGAANKDGDDDGTKPPDLSSAALRKWVIEQRNLAKDFTKKDGPRMYAANVLQELATFMNGLTLDKFMMDACKRFRMRCQHHWDEEEIKEHWTATLIHSPRR